MQFGYWNVNIFHIMRAIFATWKWMNQPKCLQIFYQMFLGKWPERLRPDDLIKNIPSFLDKRINQIIFDKQVWQNISFVFTRDLRARVFKHLRPARATRTRAPQRMRTRKILHLMKLFFASRAHNARDSRRNFCTVIFKQKIFCWFEKHIQLIFNMSF